MNNREEREEWKDGIDTILRYHINHYNRGTRGRRWEGMNRRNK
jgi:hypothetical protein